MEVVSYLKDGDNMFLKYGEHVIEVRLCVESEDIVSVIVSKMNEFIQKHNKENDDIGITVPETNNKVGVLIYRDKQLEDTKYFYFEDYE